MKKNCWTCKRLYAMGGAINICEGCLRPGVEAWIDANPTQAGTGMPDKASDGCPGWEQK